MNEIIQENAILAGRTDRSYWDVEHSTQIEGFATDMSVNAGTRVDFKINVNGGAGSDYKVEIFRLGYYGGSGAREVAQWTNTNATVQPNALVNAATGTVDAGNWSVTDGWNVPSGAVSGVYLARLQRLDSNGNPIDGAVNQVPFIVRNDGEQHDIVLQTSDTTWQAYNAWGGNNGVVGANLYGDKNDSINWDPIPGAGNIAQDRAYAVSYNRPFITRDSTGQASGPQDYLFGADYAAIYWLEKEGYDVSYISGVDTDRLGADYLKNYKAFISVGHDEYWSGGQRANVEAARDAGVNLLFWSGNEVYWKTRWDVAYSADGTAYRTLVCYKETLAVANSNAGPQDYYNLDPSNTWTGTWMDTRFHGNPLAGGGNPQDVNPITGLNPACHCGQNQLTGQLFGPDGTGQFGGALDVPSNYGSLRVWRDTTVANGGKLDIAPGILGYEWDTSPDDILRPAGLIKLSETTLPWDAILVDQGNTVAPGVATHNLSLYRTESGSLVFGAGTTFWTWALSNEHDSSPYGANIENVDIQQFTINMFADMGIQPGVADAFLISQGLKRASASTDTTPAVASINNLPDTIEALSAVTITGTATDIDGNPLTTDGKVAVVEVSVDGGTTWKVASSADNWATWSFYWFPTSQGAATIKARAIDDSLNVYNITPGSEAVTITAPTTFSAFSGRTPGSPSMNNDGTTIELGMRFAVDRVGSVTDLRYWRGSGDANDTDVREGHLWRTDGTLLGTVTFTSGPGQAGWQVASLSSPVTLTAGTQYIVSYRTNDHYVSTNNYFVDANDVAFDGLDNNSFWGQGGVVRVVQDGVGGTNGVFNYGSGAPVMPSQSYNSANYWVDITFDAVTPPVNSAPVITSAAALTSPENRLAAGTITATDVDANPLTYAIVGGVDAARFTIDAQTGLLRFVTAPDYEAPADTGANNVYDLTVSVSDGIAPAVTQAITVTVTDRAENGITGSSVFDTIDAPTTIVTTDPTDYELGMRFTANAAGSITELRYFRGAADAGDTDTRVLNLWNGNGTLLGSVTVISTAGESGWQVGALSAPIAITAGATYVVSYGTTQNYAATANYFSTAHSGPDGVLTAGVASGVFAAGTTGVFPTGTYNATNYWADVTFVPTPNVAPVFTSAAALTSPENRLTAGAITATDANANPLTYAIVGGADAALFTIDAQTGLLRFVTAPDYEAPADTGANNVYDLTVSVSDGIAPAVTQAITVSVADRAENGGGSSVFGSSDAPTTTMTTDPTDYELGMRFTANVAGTITELRYFRGAADAGDIDTRVLNLWNAAGVLLGSVTVTSAAGEFDWQVGVLSTPIAIAAGATYVVSYGTTQNYASTANYFATPHTGPDGVLTAGVASGVFAAGTPGTFPTNTYNATNYWADVTFVPAPNSAPVFTSGTAFTSPENQLIARTIIATDADANPLTYAIVGGADAARFTIDAQTGLLRFVTAPDYEAPADTGANNVYDLTVSVSDGIAPAVTQAITVTVTDRAENGTSSNVFGLTDEPTTTVTTDPADYELGMRFTANAAGSITELRYFRGATDAGDTDTRVLNLWNGNGTLLGSVTVTSTVGETGWQIGTLAAPIAITAGATYVVSYGTTQNYASTANYFATPHTGPDGVLTAGVASGVFAAGTPGIFPTATHNATNYWADVTFVPAPNSAPVFTSGTAFTSPENQLIARTIIATDADANPLTYAIVGGADAARFTIDAQTGLLRFVTAPDYEAPADTGANNVYDLTVSVSDGIAPAVTQAITVTVTDRAENGTSSNVFGLTDEPTTTVTTDPTDYELGMRFTANAAGSITELRYFRGATDAGDTDTRVLNLWNGNGTLLGSVTVTSTVGETGWQVGTLAAPIAITAGATYVVSYGTTQNYASTANYFATPHTGPDGVLTAGVASGVFAAGTPGVFPTATHNATNYWADVTFVPPSTPAVLSSATVGLSETNAVLTTGGTLTISDVDSPATFVAQAGTAGSYGTFTIDMAGVWSYTASSAHDAFVAGTTYSDTFQVASADGTTTSVTVNILGTNDAAVLSSATVGLSETDAVLTTGGALTISDVDSPATFVAQAGTAGSYGTFAVNAAGVWSYTASSAHDAFVAGTTYSDTFQVASADGTTTSVTVNILGTNDAAVLSSATVGLNETNAVLTTGGTLTISDVDSPATFVAQAGTVGGYGTFTIDAAGVWSYTASSAHDAFVAGTTYSDTFQVASADGTMTSVTVNILGTNDPTVVSGVTITGTQISFVATDPDSGTLALASPFAALFANPTITSGATTNLTPVSQAAAVSGTLQVTDGSTAVDVIGLYLGTSNGDSFTAGSTSTAIYGFGGNDILTGGTAADFIFGGTGADTIAAGAGNDTINLANGDFAAGESIDGGANSDTIVLTNATTVDFSVGTVTNVEALTGSTGNDTVTLLALQLAGLGSVNLVSGTDTLNVVANGNISQLALAALSNITTAKLVGTAGTDSITLTGAQLDAILIGSGTINLGAGTGDTINLTSTSSGLNTLGGATDASIQGVEAISAATAGGGVTITLSGQTEAFLITGSSFADTITGGAGADTIVAGGGADTIVAGAGNDTINLANGVFAAGESIDGGANSDTIVLTNATTVDFSVGTLTNVETLTGSTGNDTVTLLALQLAGLGGVNLVSGTDTLNVVANGNISQLALAALSNIDTGNLVGTTGTDSITLTGAQLNAILIGSGIINLGVGTGDTINLTSTSSDLNTLGATDASIQGVEAISAATAGAGVTITLSGQTEAFLITGSGFADTITGSEGADTIVAGAGNDTINLANGDFVAGESIDGGANSDTIVLANATTVDFSVGTVTNVETLTGSSISNDTVTLSALQLTGLSSVNLGIIDTDTLNVVANGNISQLALAALSNIDTGNLVGTTGTDSITLTGAQLNTILIGSGTINLGAGTGDTINLTSTSSDLNALGATNASIQGVEAISAATAGAGVTITLSGQTEAFLITGSGFADTVTGGTGADTIVAGGGADTIVGGGGADIISVGASDDNVRDAVRFTAASDYGDTVSNFDVTGTSAQVDVVQFTGALNTLFDDVANDDVFTFASGNGINNDNVAVNLNAVEGLYLSGANNEGVANASLGSASAVAAEFNNEFAITSSNGQDALLVVNDTDGNNFAVWQYTESTGGAEISAAELTLIGVFQANGTATTSEFLLA